MKMNDQKYFQVFPSTYSAVMRNLKMNGCILFHISLTLFVAGKYFCITT